MGIPKGWTFLGEGEFNKAYRSPDEKLVFKIRKKELKKAKTDNPWRSAELWNLINWDLRPKARVWRGGWICPFIEGKEASDSEIKEAILNIFNKTGRIVVDATAHNNFIKTPDGKVVCVDIALALLLEGIEDTNYNQSTKRKSKISNDYWNSTKKKFGTFFAENARRLPQTVGMRKALLVVNWIRPDIRNADFLKKDTVNYIRLVGIYDALVAPTVSQEAIQAATNVLQAACPVTFLSIQEGCIHALNQCINSGSENTSPTMFGINFSQKDLVTSIKEAETVGEIEANLREVKPYLPGTIITKCLTITSLEQNPQLLNNKI